MLPPSGGTPARSSIPWLAGAAAVLLAILFALRPDARLLRGDEGTFVAMASSLARDLDLRFELADRQWAEQHAGGPVAVILQRAPSGVHYSKPVLYPLLAAPFVALAGEWGPVALHLLVLAAAGRLATRWLARLGDPERARDAVLTFVAAGVPLAFVVWRMTEALQLALALAGLVLALASLERAAPAAARLDRLLASRKADLAGGALLGLLVSLREPNALVAVVPVAAALLAHRWRIAARLLASTALAYVVVLGATIGLAGAPNPYKAVRATFNLETGYPVGEGAAAALARFDDSRHLATSSLGLGSEHDAARSAYAALYFLIGRHSGLLVYFPGVVVLLVVALRRADRRGGVALTGFAALALFYVAWMPGNYFGGSTFVGNRYILAAAPCALVALRRLPSRRTLLVAWAIAAAAGLSALVSVTRAASLDAGSQNHAYAGLFRWLPYESVASEIDGRRDRYWSGDFLRFVDPFARVEAWSFELATGSPPAEIELATHWPGEAMRWLVHADSPDATLVVSDWRGSERHPLTEFAGGRSGGPLLLQTAPAWRRHRFWWPVDAPYRVRAMRFAVETADGRPAKLRLRYLGREKLPEEGFGRDVTRAILPERVPAGGALRIPVALANTGAWPWRGDAVLPVSLGMRFAPLDAGGAESEARASLPHAVPPGGRLEMVAEFAAPERPGRYRATFDLVLEDVAWFASRLGAPLAEGVVEVTAAGP